MRTVQYYFGTKLELLREANQQALQLIGTRLAASRLLALRGVETRRPAPSCPAIIPRFLPTDDESRRAMLLYYVFYTAQMTDAGPPRRRRGPPGLHRPHHRAESGTPPRPTDRCRHPLRPSSEAALLLAIVPGAASGVLKRLHRHRIQATVHGRLHRRPNLPRAELRLPRYPALAGTVRPWLPASSVPRRSPSC